MTQQVLDHGHEQFLAAMKAGDAGALAAFLTDDVTFCPPHEPVKKGKQEVKAWLHQVFNQVTTQRLSVSDRNVIVAGDWAFETGMFVWAVTPAAGGERIEDTGRFLAVWQRQADGAWKVFHDIWNSSNPAGTR